MLNLQIILIFTAISIIIISSLIYSHDKNKISLHKTLDKKDTVILIIFTIVSFFITFYNHSSFVPYNNLWHATQSSDKLVLTLEKPESVSQIFYSTGFIKGDYSIYVLMNRDHRKHFIEDTTKDKGYQEIRKISLNSCFMCFRRINIDLKLKPGIKISNIVFQAETPPVSIGNIILLDNQKHVIEYNTTNTSIHHRNNEFLQSYLTNPVYDELYYVGSAYEYLHHMVPEVGEHPQLAILITAFSAKIFQFSPFAWRVVPNLIGIILVILIYLFTKSLFNKSWLATLAALFVLIDPMHNVITKFALLDPYVTFFLTIEYYFLWRYYNLRVYGESFKFASKNLLFMSIAFALAVSSKWNGLFSIITVVILLIYCEFITPRKKNDSLYIKMIFVIFVLLLLPVLIYTTSYIPIARYFNVHNIFKFVFAQQLQMLNNMNGITTPLWYQSKAWEWLANMGAFPIVVIPQIIDNVINHQFFENYYLKANSCSLIVFFLNPGLIALFPVILVTIIYNFSSKKDHVALFILFTIVAQYIPFMFFKRVSYNYYFYSVEPSMILGVAYTFNYLSQKIKYSVIIIGCYTFLNILLFFWYFPIISGIMLKGRTIMIIYESIQPLTLVCTVITLLTTFAIYRVIKIKALAK